MISHRRRIQERLAARVLIAALLKYMTEKKNKALLQEAQAQAKKEQRRGVLQRMNTMSSMASIAANRERELAHMQELLKEKDVKIAAMEEEHHKALEALKMEQRAERTEQLSKHTAQMPKNAVADVEYKDV